MRTLIMLAVLSLSCAPAYAGSDQSLGLAYRAAAIILAAGEGQAEVPPAQARPVQPTLSAFAQRVLALQLKVLTDETKELPLRQSALKNIATFPPGPHDAQIRSALKTVIEATPNGGATFSDRDELSFDTLTLLKGIALKSDAGTTREIVEAMGKVLTRSKLRIGVHSEALGGLISIAKARPEAAEPVLTHLIKVIDSQIDSSIRKRALNASLEISRELAKSEAADPVPGPVKLERIP